MSRNAPSSDRSSFLSCSAGMHKNQLQELAQRSCFNLPSYSCSREGPDHAPRFKATVSFNGEVFESPGYHTTLRQAEHAAAEVALNTLSKRGPTQYLASRILDETGVCKNLLQETAQRAGVSLPVYTTIRSGPKHLPLFKCMVEVGGRRFMGDPAKTKKQAEKNAATAAWSALQRHSSGSRLADCNDEDDSVISKTNAQFLSARSRTRTGNIRDKIRSGGRDGYSSPGNFFAAHPSSGVALEALNHDSTPNLNLFNQAEERPYHLGANHFYASHTSPSSMRAPFGQADCLQRRHSLSGMEPPADSHEAMVSNMATGGGNSSIRGVARYHHHPRQPHRIRGLPLQSLSERFDLNRPSLLDELQQRDDEDWRHGDPVPHQHHLRSRMQSLSERFEYRSYLPQLDEEFSRGNEEWLPSDSMTGGNFRGNAYLDNSDQIFEQNRGYNEGWLRGDMLLQKLEEQKKYGYKEGWLQGDILKHNLPEENGQMWLQAEAQKFRLEEDEIRNRYGANGGGGHLNPNSDGWFKGEYLGSNADKESMRGIGYGMPYQNDVEHDQEAVYRALIAQSTSAMVPSCSSLSSLSSKSTQWWASHIPGSTSSTTAALVVSSLGLRPAANMAPAVRVRHMVPVCSAPPQRCNDARASVHAATMTDLSSSVMDSDLGVQHLFNKLRL